MPRTRRSAFARPIDAIAPLPMAELVDAVAEIKADGARISPADVLAQLQKQPEFSDVTLSQVPGAACHHMRHSFRFSSACSRLRGMMGQMLQR